MKFLIDECLSPQLVQKAIEYGYSQSAHVTRRKMGGMEDHELIKKIIDQDWTFVTRNSDDFRALNESKSKAPVYSHHEIHAGLICLNLPQGSNRWDQIAYFGHALNKIGDPCSFVSQVLEVWPNPASSMKVEIQIYKYP